MSGRYDSRRASSSLPFPSIAGAAACDLASVAALIGDPGRAAMCLRSRRTGGIATSGSLGSGVARALESLALVAPPRTARSAQEAFLAKGIRFAHTCYD